MKHWIDRLTAWWRARAYPWTTLTCLAFGVGYIALGVCARFPGLAILGLLALLGAAVYGRRRRDG